MMNHLVVVVKVLMELDDENSIGKRRNQFIEI